MSNRLEDEVAIVHGATRGMGRAIVERFAAEGARVVFTGRNEDRGRDLERAVSSAGGTAVFVRADMTSESDIEDAVGQTVERFGMLTIVVNNAGGVELSAGVTKIDGKVAEVTSDSWDRIVATVLKGPWLSCKYAIPEMVKAGRGSILNVSSFAAELVVVGNSTYSAAKAGLHALTRSVAIEYAPENIRCNCMLVGLVPNWQTEFFLEPAWRQALRSVQPLRLGEDDDPANAALFLCSKEAGYITGTVLHVDGGLTKIVNIPSTPAEGGDQSFVKAGQEVAAGTP